LRNHIKRHLSYKNISNLKNVSSLKNIKLKADFRTRQFIPNDFTRYEKNGFNISNHIFHRWLVNNEIALYAQYAARWEVSRNWGTSLRMWIHFIWVLDQLLLWPVVSQHPRYVDPDHVDHPPSWKKLAVRGELVARADHELCMLLTPKLFE